MTRRVVGLMSGTSCDGLDAVAVELSGGDGSGPLVARLVAHRARDWGATERERLLAAGAASAVELALLHRDLGLACAAAVRELLTAADWRASDVDVVGWAGHTAVHLPPTPGGDPGATLVLGDGDVIAEGCGCPVLTELRARDRAAGGQGAPLVPFADAALLRRPDRVVGALNLGGIANLTVVPPAGPPVAFDTGPANMLLDGALARASDGARRFDEGGALGLAGRVDEAWLEAALAADGFLALPPPRSTGRERYGAAFLDAHWAHLGRLELADLAATLAAYTVRAVVRAVADHVAEPPAEWVVSGGGAANACLMAGLAAGLAPATVATSEERLGLPSAAREALAMAVLADASLRGRPANVPAVTGALRAVRLGKLCFGVDGA